MKTDEGVVLKEVVIEQIKDPTVPIRMMMDDDKMYELVESMKKIGLIQPIVVTAIEGGYEVLAGHRRLIAARRLRWLTIRAIIMPAVYEYGDVIKLHENLMREDVHPIDESNFLHELKERLNLSVEKLAALIFKSEAYVYEKLAMKEWPPDVLKDLGENEITYSVAREFAKITDKSVLIEYLRFAKEGGCTPAVAKKWREGWERDKLERTAAAVEPDHGTPDKPAEAIYAPCYICREPKDITKTVMMRVCENCEKVVNQALVERVETPH